MTTNQSLSFKQKNGMYRKTKLDDNCWMTLYRSGSPGAEIVSFLDSEYQNITVPDGFILTDITSGEPIMINPISQQLFGLVKTNNYSFTYKERTGKLILEWETIGDFVWE